MKLLYCIIAFFLGAHTLDAQRLNRLNSKGLRTGRWIIYRDSAKTQKLFEGRFRNGEAVGRARYYSPVGIVERKELMRFGRMRTRLYHPDGTLEMIGKARLVEDSLKYHYFFYGRWRYYDEAGRLEKYLYYEKGKLVRTVRLGKDFSGPLISLLEGLEAGFINKNQKLLKEIAAAASDPEKVERLEQELLKNDEYTFQRLDSVLSNGYPGRQLLDEKVYIPFYILSYAPAAHKQKYLGILQQAADRGDIAWSSLAIFIDKISVARGEPQLYGSQGFIRDNRWQVYPVADPERLRERRLEKGLPVD